jgi:hypothetical protein
MFLDKLMETNNIEVIDDYKYKSILDLELECIESEYNLDCIMECTLPINESISDKLNSAKEYLKKLWKRFIDFIKRIWEMTSKRFNKIHDKIKNYTNKNIRIKSSFELIVPKIGEIKFVSFEELEKLVNLYEPDIHDDIKTKKFIEDFKDIDIKELEKKITEKLSSAIGANGINANTFYNNDFNIEKDLGINKIKIETIEDLKKTEYYNHLNKGELYNAYYNLADKIYTEMVHNQNKTDGIFAGVSHINTDIKHDDFKKFINVGSNFNKVIDIYVKITKMLMKNYIIYHNIIAKLSNNVIKNYNIILSHSEFDTATAAKLNTSRDEHNLDQNMKNL